MKKSYVNVRNTVFRPDDTYTRVIQNIRKDGVCPFCPANLTRYHKRPIIKDGTHWILTDNMYPYKGAKHHLLFVHKKHVSDIGDITAAGWQELQVLADFIVKKRKIKGGALAMRFGGTSYTGASVSHFHAQLISRGAPAKNQDPISFRVG